jgi:hypothetical protein
MQANTSLRFKESVAKCEVIKNQQKYFHFEKIFSKWNVIKYKMQKNSCYYPVLFDLPVQSGEANIQ